MKYIHPFRTLTVFALSLLFASSASAYGNSRYGEFARVVDVHPVYQRVARETPERSCHYESAISRSSDSYTGTVVGGLLGAAIGHELGNSKRNKNVGAVAGGVLGATIGRDISRSRTPSSREYHAERVCHTRYHTEYSERLMGYDVTYQYHGRLYQTRTDHHPGKRIPVDVHVRPVYMRR